MKTEDIKDKNEKAPIQYYYDLTTATDPIATSTPKSSEPETKTAIEQKTEKEKNNSNIDIMAFILEKVQKYAKENKEKVELRECLCPNIARYAPESPRNDADKIAIEYLKKTFPLNEGHTTLNLTFVGEGSMLYSAHFIGECNKIGYSVNSTILDRDYVTLSDAYVDYRLDAFNTYQTSHGTLPNIDPNTNPSNRFSVLDTIDGFVERLPHYRTALRQYCHILTELGGAFGVQNKLQGYFYSMEAYVGVLKKNIFHLAQIEHGTRNPSKPLPYYSDEYARNVAYSGEQQGYFTGEYWKFFDNYKNTQKTNTSLLQKDQIHGLFFIDCTPDKAEIEAMIKQLPENSRERGLAFATYKTSTTQVLATYALKERNKSLLELEKTEYTIPGTQMVTRLRRQM